MKRMCGCVVLSLVYGVIHIASAKETTEEVVQRLIEMGEGVPSDQVKKNEDGTLRSLKIVGKERISTVLGKAKGLQSAQSRATMKANAAFVTWMANNVTSISSLDDETIVTLSGDGDQVSEQGKTSEINRQQIQTQAQGLVKGLTLVAKDINPNTQMMTLIFSWSPDRAALANEARQGNKRTGGTRAQPSGDSEPARKTVVSPDFDD